MARGLKSLLLVFLLLTFPLTGCLGGDDSQDESEQTDVISDDLNETNISPIPELRGSWTDPIHSSNMSRSNIFDCSTTEGWRTVDANATVDVLEATGQNLYLMETTPVDGSNSECVWGNIDRILDAIDESSSEIQLMTVMADNHSLTQYYEIINKTREKADLHSSLFATTIDDFHEVLAKPVNLEGGDGLTKSQVSELYNATNSQLLNHSSVEFMPYLPAESIPTYFADDAIMFGTVGCNSNCSLKNGTLGLSGDFYIYPEDELRLNASFVTPSGFGDKQAKLSFILQESLNVRPYTMDLVIEINGLEVGRHSMVDSPGNDASITVMNVSIPDLVEGEINDFGLRIDTNGSTVTKYRHKIAYLWDFKITTLEGSESDVELINLERNATRGVVQGRSLYQLDAFVASNNSEWNIADSMDGILFKFPLRVQHYDSDVHHRYVKAVCEMAEGKNIPCMEVFWANDQWTGDVIGSRGTPSLNVYIDSASEFADGIIFWMLDLNLYDRSLGKLSLREPWTSDLQTAVGFASSTSPTPGYYHRWYFSVPSDGNYTIIYNTKTNLEAGHIFHTIEVNGVRVVDSDAAVLWNYKAYTIELENKDRLIVRVESVDGYSGNYYASEWGISNLEGVEINFSDAHHVSGVGDSTEYMFDVITNRLMLWDLLLDE